MNVYDFDKTVFEKDSSVSFYFFCLLRCIACIKYLPLQILGFLKYIFGFIDKTKFKGYFFSFLRAIDNVDMQVARYWEKNRKYIRQWYLSEKRPDDVIISASPRFLLAPICDEMGVRLICSEVDKKTGCFLSENCYGEEKVRRFLSEFSDAEIFRFYSDSQSDAPIATLAMEPHIVRGETILKWNEYHPSFVSKIKKLFLSKEFIAFLIIGFVNAFNGVLFASIISFLTDPNLAFALGYVLSLTISYFLNTFLAFKERLGFGKYLKFCVSYIPNFLLQNGIVFLFYNLLGWNRFIVYIAAVTIAIPITFIMINFFAFAKRK